MNKNEKRRRFPSGLAEKFGKDRVVFCAILLLWIPWGILCFPGNLPWDAGSSIAWFLNLDRSNVNNPWFQNLMMGLFYQAGNLAGLPWAGVYLYCWLQMGLEAWLLGKITAYLADRAGAGRWAYLLIPFYGLLPVFPIYAFMMGKDSSFALAMLGMVYLLIRAAAEKEAFWQKKRNLLLLGAMPAVLGLLRNYGGVIPAVLFAILALKALKKRGILPAAASVLALLLATVGIPKAAGIPDGEIRETMSIPLQTTAYYLSAHWEEVTEEEKETIAGAVDLRVMEEDYFPAIADPIKDKSSFTPETRGAFLRMWLGLLRKHPETILNAWRMSTWQYFSADEVSEVKSHVFIGVCLDPNLWETLGLEGGSEKNRAAKEAWHLSLQIPGVRQLEMIGIYSWLALALTLLALAWKRMRKYLPCCILLIMVLGACLVSPVNGYYRYAYPMILSIPPVLAAMAGTLRRRKKA